MDAFELWCWRRLLRVPWTARRSNQSILKEISLLWPPAVKSCLIWKDPDTEKDWGQEEMGTTEDEMVGWHQWLYGHEFEQAPGVGDEQGNLACCSPWGLKESDTTEWLNWLRDWTCISCIEDIFFTCWVTGDAQYYNYLICPGGYYGIYVVL